jgi:transposase
MDEQKKRRKYPKGFKLNAIKLVDEDNLTYEDAGRQLNTSPNNIARWHQLHHNRKKNPLLGEFTNQDLKKVIEDLQIKNSQLRNEHSILFKCLIFLAKKYNDNLL